MKTNMRRALMAVSAALILVIAVGIIAKLWLIPAAIRKGITTETTRFWPGHVHIEGLKFSFRGRVILNQLLLKDSQGKNGFCLENIKAFLPDISRLNFKVKSLEIASADIDLFLPPKSPAAKPIKFSDYFSLLESGYFDIKQFIIDNISVTLHSASEEKMTYENLQLYINKLPDVYKISFTQASALESQVFGLEGTWNPGNKNCDFELLLKHSFQSEEVAVLTGLLGIDSSCRSEGPLDATIRVSHKPKELDPTSLNGTIDFDNWKISGNENPLLQKLYTKIVLDNNQCKIENLTADICQGVLEGSLTINNWKKINEFFCTGRFSGKQIDLPQLSKCIDLPQKLSKGTLSFEYDVIRDDTNDPKKLAGEGIVFINDSDLYQLPVISHVFAFVGLKANNLQRATDAMVFFRNAGSVVTINKGQVANRFWAIRVMPGGQVDVQNKTVDMHVVVIPLGQIEDIVRKLPFAELFGKVKDKLTRLKVKGKWSDPAGKLIIKEPLTDVKEATVSFIRDVVDTSGQITEKMRKPFKEMFNNKNRQKQ